MPLYEYECEDCGHRFERIQKFSDALVSTCPSCGGKVHKLASSPAIQFKGTGWYVTDYARKPSDGEAAGTSNDASSSTTKDSASGDSGSSSETKTSSTSKTESSSSSSSPATK